MVVSSEPQSSVRRFALPGRGGEMTALDFGPEARPVDIVFSHANGLNARTYRTILAPLARHCRILALDLRGHGATTLRADPERWNRWQGYAEDLQALLATAVDRPVVLAGHSIGATTSLIAAVQAPALVRSLVLFDPVLFEPERRLAPLWDDPLVQGTLRRRTVFPDRASVMASYRGRGAFAGWSDPELADYVAAGFRERPDGDLELVCRPEWEVLMYAYHDYDPPALFGALRRPMWIFAAEAASTMGAQARALAPVLEVLPGTTHFLPMQRPEFVRQALMTAARSRAC